MSQNLKEQIHNSIFIHILASHLWITTDLLVLHEGKIPNTLTLQSFLQTFFCGKIFSVKWHIKGISLCFDSVKHPNFGPSSVHSGGLD